MKPTKGSKSAPIFVQPGEALRIVQPVVNEVFQRMRESRAPFFPGARRNLENWMARLVRGNGTDDRPPIWKDVPRERVKTMLDSLVNSHSSLVIQNDTRVPGFSKFWVTVEKDQAAALGPSSEYASYLVDGVKKIEAVYSDKPVTSLSINEAASRKAMQHIMRLLPARSIRPVAMKAVRPSGEQGASKSRLDGSTNSGWPAWLRDWYKLSRKDDAHRLYRQWLEDTVREFVEECYSAGKWENCIPDYVATTGQRLVSKGPNPLVPKDGKWKGKRFVIAMPKTETWPGKMGFVPLQEQLLGVRNEKCPVRLFSGWLKMPELDKNMQVLLEYAHKNKLPIVSGDLSSFDATVPPAKWWELKLAMSNWFETNYAKMFLAISFADIYRTSLITPTKIFEAQPSSVKSGSIFTNVDDSLFNYYVQLYGYYSGYYGLPVSAVNGDDIVACAPEMTLESLAQAFKDHGMVMNVEKSLMETDQLHFLQRTHSLGLPGGMGSIYRVLVKCLAVEDDSQLRYDERNKYAYAVQAISRLENACFNPCFHLLVELIAQGDKKFHLGSSLPAAAVAKGAGDYALRKFNSAERNVWSPAGSGVPFTHWATNRVLRGETLPPPGLDRFKSIYGVTYSSVRI